MAKKFKGETVTEFAASPGPGVKGDIDVVTRQRVYEVKAGKPSNFDTQSLEQQFIRMADYAKSNGGKTPVLAIKQEYLPLDEDKFKVLLDFVRRHGGVIEGY